MEPGHVYTLPSGRQIPIVDGMVMCRADQIADSPVSSE